MGMFDFLGSFGPQAGGTPAATPNWLPALAIGADQVGSRLSPNNPFAGIGTSLAQSHLAGKARAEDKAQQKSWVEQIIKGITGKDQDGPSSLTLSIDPATGKLGYGIKGIGNFDMKMGDLGGMSSPVSAPQSTNPFEALGYKPIGG